MFLVFRAEDGQNQIWRNGAGGDLPGTFRDSGQRIKNVNSTAIALGDLNGNGHLDAFISTGNTLFESQSNLIWLNNRDGTGNITEQCLGSEPSLSVALGDLNDNRYLDAFVGNFGSDQVWLNGVGDVCFCIVDWLYRQTPIQQAIIMPSQEGAQPYRALRDQILAHSRQGQRYARLYDQHNAQVFSLILADSELQLEAFVLLQIWQPLIQALAMGNGDSAVIGQTQIDALAAFLNTLAAAGSPDLHNMIRRELANLPPLETLVGQSMTKARINIGLDREDLYLPFLPN